MASDVMRLMELLGQQRFAAAGHDRGSYVAQASPWTTPSK